MRIVLWVILCLLFLVSSGQRTKEVHGYLHDKFTFQPIEGAKILTEDSAFVAYSNSTGFYKLILPKKTKRLHFMHENYELDRIRLSRRHTRVDLRMYPLKEFKIRYGELPGKNSISWLPLKLIWGALGLRYERFIGMKFSIGTYVDWYFKGKQYFGDEEYTGLKVTPTFRYFFRHHEAMGFYIQGSAIIGYFDFSVLNYVHPSGHEISYSVTEKFWTGGFGGAIGAYFSFVRNNSGFIDLNVGFQVMPANYPLSIDTPNGVYEHYNGWWYLGGPGSIIEIKIAIGGIF